MDRRRDLEEIRGQLAEIDADIVRAVQKRARLASQLRELGAAPAPPRSVGEVELHQAIASMGGTDLAPDAVRAVLEEVHAATASFERAARVAVAGVEGDFGELVARRRFGADARLRLVPSAVEAADEVSRGRADCAVVLFESSRDGLNQDSLEALAAAGLLMVAKVEVAAELSLMVRPESSEERGADGLEETRADAASFDAVFFAQCHRVLLGRYLAEARDVAREVSSPKAAALAVLEAPRSAAVIPEQVGGGVGLTVLQSNVGDRSDLRLRLAIASSRPTPRTGEDTTALLFGVHERPNALFEILAELAERGIGVKVIQGRPAPADGWASRFYVEVSGHVADRPMVSALEHVKKTARFLKVLGSFPSC